MVDRGLVAQLRTANFLTGQAYVALDFFPKALPSRPAKKEAVPGMNVGEPGSYSCCPLFQAVRTKFRDRFRK